MKIIIVGAGDVGYHIASTLARENKDVVVIEINEEAIRKISETLDVQVIRGSGSNPKILQEAGIDQADMLIAATNSDEVNMIACLIAQSQADIPTKIARIRNKDYLLESKIFDKEHLDIDLSINPEEEVVKHVLKLIEVPGAKDVVDFADGKIKMIQWQVDREVPFIGKRLMDMDQWQPDQKVLIAAISRRNRIIIPSGKDEIQEGDNLFLITESHRVSDVYRFMGKAAEPAHRAIIYGGTKIGLNLAQDLEKRLSSTKVICRDQAQCETLVEHLDKAIVLYGDGTDQNLLREENVKGVDYFISVSQDEEANVLIALLAKQLGAKKVMALVNKLSYVHLISTIGVDVVINPQLAAVNRILQYIRKGMVLSVATLMEDEAEAIEVVALETSDLVHRPLKDIKFPKNALIGTIVRNGQTIVPHGETVILPQDRVIIFAKKSAISAVEKALMVKLEYF